MSAPTNIQQIGTFFDEIRPWARAYRGRSLDYFGIETDDGIHLCVARIRLQTQQVSDTRRFRFRGYAAGSLPLVGAIDRIRQLVECVFRANVPSDSGRT